MSGQRGIAMINALVIVAMLSVTALALQARALRGVTLSQTAQDGAQAALYLDGGASLAELVLGRDRRTGAFDSLDEDWARTDVTVPVDRGRLALGLRDLQGAFNLNLLADPDDPTGARGTFRALCLGLGLGPATAEQIAGAMARTGPLAALAELGDVPGLDPAAWARLAPFVAVLPERPALNVNTAPAPVLAAFLPDLDAEQVAALVERRAGAPFAEVEDFAATVRPLLPAPRREAETFRRFTTGSAWFALTATASLGEVQRSRVTILHRPPEDAPIRRVRHEPMWSQPWP